jgi:hypothetical protein
VNDDSDQAAARAAEIVALTRACEQIRAHERAGDLSHAEGAQMLEQAHAQYDMHLRDITPASVPDHEARMRGIQLADLFWHWGSAYRITWDARTGFRAARRDNGAAISTPTGADLFEEIRVDYTARPVPRTGGILP